jgi:hypothetical protein
MMADLDDAPEIGADEDIDAPAEEQVEAPELSEVEALASELGWKPKADWKGDETEWRPAADFMRARAEVGRALKKTVRGLEKQVEGISRASATMTERAVAEARQQWEARHDQAVEEGDKDAARQASRELAKLEQQGTSVPPEAQDFAQRHASWFNKNEEATNYAVNRAQHYAEQGLSHARQLAAVEKDMRGLFPELFEDPETRPATKSPPSVGAPQRTARPAPREKGYATLPPEARKACDAYVARNGTRFASMSATQVRDQWAKNFYEDQEA